MNIDEIACENVLLLRMLGEEIKKHGIIPLDKTRQLFLKKVNSSFWVV